MDQMQKQRLGKGIFQGRTQQIKPCKGNHKKIGKESQSILNTLRNDYILTGEFEIKLLDFVNETYKKSSLSAPDYVSSISEKILFNQTGEVIDEKTIPEYEKNKSIEEIFKDLNDLVGLDNVKGMLKDLVSLMEFKKKTTNDLKIKELHYESSNGTNLKVELSENRGKFLVLPLRSNS